MQKTSKHLDNNKRATVASGESRTTHLMDGIVTGLPKKVSPAIVDGIVRGIAKGGGSSGMRGVASSSTANAKGEFGSGAFAEGAK